MKEIIARFRDELHVSRPEAELIVAALLERPRFELFLNQEMEPAEHARLMFRLSQLKRGVPLEYVTRKVQFMDRTLEIHAGVFIPRIETEYFIERIWKSVPEAPARILEIGTGCGVIAISLADIFPQARICATDVSDRALDTARVNIDNFGLGARIELVKTDLFRGLTRRFDLIVSNPPYIPRDRIPMLPKSVREYEPIRALNGGEGGIQFIKRLLRGAPDRLAAGGVIGLEIDEDSVPALTGHLAKTSGPYRFDKDLFDRYRYLFLGGFRS
jgi:release factor-specific protein-(glutamine-N5) methyltransferase